MRRSPCPNRSPLDDPKALDANVSGSDLITGERRRREMAHVAAAEKASAPRGRARYVSGTSVRADATRPPLRTWAESLRMFPAIGAFVLKSRD